MKNRFPLNPYFYSVEGSEIKDLIYEQGDKVVYPAKKTIINGGELIDHFYYIDEGNVTMRVCNENGMGVLTELPLHCHCVSDPEENIRASLRRTSRCSDFSHGMGVFWRVLPLHVIASAATLSTTSGLSNLPH